MRWIHQSTAAVAVAALLLLCEPIVAVIPSGILHLSVKQSEDVVVHTDMLVAPSSQSGWGPHLPPKASNAYPVRFATDGCSPLLAEYKNTYVVVDRGNCSFFDKAIHASNSGASALIIRNTRETVYFVDRNRSSSGNLSDGASSIPSFATDCSNGQAFIPALDPQSPWLVRSPACSENPACASRICIPTGIEVSSRGFQVCCMWDTHLLMGVNYTLLKNSTLNLPIVFATVGQGENLTSIHASSKSIQGALESRPASIFGAASIVLWILGIGTAISGAFYAASVERQQQLATKSHAHADDHDDIDDDAVDVSFRHAIFFIIFAGLFLIFLYFVHVGPLLSIMFGLSSVSTFTLLVTQPLFRMILFCLKRVILRCPTGPLRLTDLLATLTSLGLVILWYVDRGDMWFLQDAFGIALCFIFLRTIRLPTLQVATVLLVLAFFYDIFFVFVTPLIFGRSVMVDVATGGPSASTKAGYPGSDFCERYPSYKPCIDPEPLPMLLIFPRLGDWRGGEAMLGLGDIVLPGLLLCFALRFDYSREVHLKQTEVVMHRYYIVTCIGYVVGLFCANLAVVLMEMGQPALLYLVPCTLGGLSITAYLSGDLHQMWNYGPYPVHPMAPTMNSPMDVEAGIGGEASPFLTE
ncbi:Signal peptide peptidase-like 2A [Aphanomyces cochlioides]|nr:Signal peptide peptidase-like 2A [Aphanomyces cochlioides]